MKVNIRRRLRTSNAIERVNEEIRRRERVIRILPNEDSLHRMIGAVLMDIHEDWQTSRRYLSLPSKTSSLPSTADTFSSDAA
ncbi:MAG: hypothetical protein GX483_09175 [Actinomycetaceae bacterium]|nr:hypothetical protein [Actinomycetaceae bacterium]